MLQLRERGWNVSVFTLITNDNFSPHHLTTLHDYFSPVLVERYKSPRIVRFLRVLGNALQGVPFQRDFFWDHEAAMSLRKHLASVDYDLIVVAQLYMYRYIPPQYHPITILDSHNVEATRVARMAFGPKRSLRAMVARLQLRNVERFEAEAANRLLHSLACSPVEVEYFERISPGKVSLVPNGVDIRQHPFRNRVPSSANLLYLGSLSYSANVDAVLYLIKEILPRLHSREVHLNIVGANPPESILEAARRSPVPTTVTGYVETTQPYVEAARIMLVPLRYGGGTRLKILEALSRGVPVVTTTVGGEGLGLEHGRHAMVADHPDEFAAWVDRLIVDVDLCHRLAVAGRELVEHHYSWETIGGSLHDVLLRLREARKPLRIRDQATQGY